MGATWVFLPTVAGPGGGQIISTETADSPQLMKLTVWRDIEFSESVVDCRVRSDNILLSDILHINPPVRGLLTCP